MDQPPSIEGSSEASSLRPEQSVFFGADGLRPVWCLLLYVAILAVQLLVGGVVTALMRYGSAEPVHAQAVEVVKPAQMFISEWMNVAFVLVATWIMSRIEDRRVTDYGLARTPNRMRWVCVGAVLGLVFQSMLILVLWSTHHLVFDAVLLRPLPAAGYGLLWLAGFIGVAFFEELFFRGYLQFVLTRFFAGVIRAVSPGFQHAQAVGFWVAAVLISFGFGFSHRTNAGESPVGLLCAGAAGMVFAFSLWRTGSLWWAIGVHTAWDWAQSFLFGVADSGTMSADRLLATHPVGQALLSGGTTGPEGSLFVLPVMAAIAIVAAVTLPRNERSFPLPEPADIHMPAAIHSAEG